MAHSSPLVRGRDPGKPPVSAWLFPLLKAAYRFLASVLPVDKRLICFSSFPDCADSALPMFLHCRQMRPKARLVWLVNDTDAAANRLMALGISLDGRRTSILNRRSIKGVIYTIRARLLFHTHGLALFACRRRGQTIVNLWHGMPLKTIGIFSGLDEKSVPAGDVAIATSPLFAEVMAEAFAMPRDSVWVTGLPRNDKLFAKARLGGGTTTKIVWMPTYRNSYHGEIRQDTGGVCENAIEDHIRSLDRRLSGRNSDVEFVVRLHPMDVLNTVCWDDLKSIKMILGSNPEPLEDTLASSDRLITDYSSVFIDYAILRRPMGFFIPDIGNYIRGFIPKVEEEICWPGTVMKTIDEIEDFVFSERLPVVDDDVLARLHSYRDAFSTRRLYDRLVEIGAF